ncbi:MAG: hypothetical protein NZ942_03005, partial [Candidatus Aenigmarchaeota archaeon]|nr:hypothetical protein [Candidatus Aenigmarchaeota archaeon]
MKKELLAMLFFLFFLPCMVFAIDFSVNPSYGDAGTNLNFNFSLNSSFKILQNITLYVPPCNETGCPSPPYYTINKDSISSFPDAKIVIEEYEGRVSRIIYSFYNSQQQVFLFFEATLDTPQKNRVDKWLCTYFWRGIKGNASTEFSVLAPNLQVLEVKIQPSKVILNSTNQQTLVLVDAIIKDVKTPNSSGTSYELNPLITI